MPSVADAGEDQINGKTQEPNRAAIEHFEQVADGFDIDPPGHVRIKFATLQGAVA